jgi:hypothetical protein
VSAAPPGDLRIRYRAARIVGTALLAAVGVYAVVIELLARGVSRQPMTYPLRHQPTFAYFLFGVGVLILVAAAVVRRTMLARKGANVAERIQGGSIVALALAETPAVFGILVFVTTGQRGAAYALFLLSLAGLALYFPGWSQWEEWTRDARSTPR